MSGIAAIVGAALVCVLGAPEAQASGFAIRENSAEALGTSFAGNASSATFLSTIFNNPAGMTEFTGDRGQTDGSLIVPSLKFSGSAHETCAGLGKFPAFCPPVPTSFPIAGDNGGDAGKSAFIPALYALHSISPDLKFGLAMTVPFGLETQYSNTWVGRYLGIKSMVQSLDINPNLAYRVNDWISVGGGISANYLYADLSKAIDFNAISHNPPGLLPDGQARFNGSDWNWGYNLGVLLKPMEGTNLGIAFRSRIQHKLQGDQTSPAYRFHFRSIRYSPTRRARCRSTCRQTSTSASRRRSPISFTSPPTCNGRSGAGCSSSSSFAIAAAPSQEASFRNTSGTPCSHRWVPPTTSMSTGRFAPASLTTRAR
jgi:long-subunit fatty acid transport protein